MNKAEQNVWERFGRSSVEVRESSEEVQDRFAQVTREEKGQLWKRLTERKKIEKTFLELAKGFWRVKNEYVIKILFTASCSFFSSC